MVNLKIIEEKEDFTEKDSEKEVIDFLYTHLDEYRDSKPDIKKAFDYAFSDESGKGGFLLTAKENNKVIGAVLINNTGMSGYIPEHILVFIAVHRDYRGKGFGKVLMNKIIDRCPGDIALHVEYDNPAVHLYKKVGFKSKYAEMRYKQNGD